MAEANVQIDGVNRDVLNDDPVPGAMIQVQLCGYGSQVPRVINAFVYANLTSQMETVADENGQYHFKLYSNDQIQPPGTYYTFTYLNRNGDIQQVNAYYFGGAGEFDTSDLVPFDPSLPPPPLPGLITNQLLLIPFSPTPVFPGDQFTTWGINLTANVTSSSMTGTVAGNLYTFLITQDSAGNHWFAWPPGVLNATEVCQAPRSITVQTFVCLANNGPFLPIAPGTYYTI